MNTQNTRLFFIDSMRAWAILMMLQGHFVDGLLDPVFRDTGNGIFSTWSYFRGITAPVFFTVSGFIFTFLLIRVPQKGLENPRVRKGIRRGLQLLFIGYLLRMNLFGLFKGEIYDSFYLVDVLHCIGMSILSIVGIYLLTAKKNSYVLPLTLTGLTLLLFLFEPVYKQWGFEFLPMAMANYFTKANGSVFTIIPWVGYTAIGGVLSILFYKYRESKLLYPKAIGLALMAGSVLIFFSSDVFVWMYEQTSIALFQMISLNNYLFIRLGDVLVVFAIFMLLRKFMANKTVLKIGANTLSIYVIHFIVLYGSFTGLGLYRFFHHQLSPVLIIPTALIFVIACTYLALLYDKHEEALKLKLNASLVLGKSQLTILQKEATPILKELVARLKGLVERIFGVIRN
ncbi:MAG: DUF1624 domain-containing protein [Croceitalea sp.]|nr:DUF1624 domain-containing protein [Croceitalea sp.]